MFCPIGVIDYNNEMHRREMFRDLVNFQNGHCKNLFNPGTIFLGYITLLDADLNFYRCDFRNLS